MMVTNCTLSENSAGYGGGGGIHNSGSLTITNSTLWGNSGGIGSGGGGGIYISPSSSTVTLNNTIVAGNGAWHGPDIYDSSGTLSGSHNLIGDGADQSALVDGVDGNQVGTASSPVDPLLSDWAQFDNGQWGYYLLPGSPAIDAGSNDLLPADTFDLDNDSDTSEPLPIDLAGTPRVSGGVVDIGTREFNAPPTADPGGPYSVDEGGLVALDASASSDPEQTDNTTLTYEWDFDYDELTFDVDSTGMSPDFSASAIDGPATRTIGLRVADDGDLSDTATITVDVTNVSPTATITGNPTASPEGVEILLGSSIADPAPADTAAGFSYSWNVTKDGAAHDSGTGDTFRLTPNDDGSYQVTLVATDKDSGVSDPATATIEITNVPPAIIIEGGDTVAEGAEYSLTLGTITDPGIDTVTQWIVHWGDGLSDTYAGGGDRTHVYENDGTYTITVDLADEDGTHAGAGSLDLTINPGGPIDFLLLEHLSLGAGSLYYQIETTHDGVLTLQIDVPKPPKSARLKLYDADPRAMVGLTPLEQSALDLDANQRIDWDVVAGETYYCEVYESNLGFNFRIANLVHQEGAAVTVHGTDSDDTFEFNAAASCDVTINGVRYHFNDAQVEEVTFVGGEGYDMVILDDSIGDDTLTAEAKHAVFSNSDQTPGFAVTMDGFEELQAYGRAGGHDKAFLYDSDANDKFKAEPAENYAKMYGGRMYNRVKFYDVVEAFSSGEKDLARLFDTAGNDVFEGQQDVSWLRTDVFDVGVHNFRQVIAYALAAGNDVATLKDSALMDEVYLKSHKSEIVDLETKGEVYKITARGFDLVHADGSQGEEYDRVKIWETPRDNHLEAAGNWARFHAQKAELEMTYDILAFEFVKARASTGGNDTANVIEPLGLDLLFEDGWDM